MKRCNTVTRRLCQQHVSDENIKQTLSAAFFKNLNAPSKTKWENARAKKEWKKIVASTKTQHSALQFISLTPLSQTVCTCVLQEYQNTGIPGYGYRPHWVTNAPRFHRVATKWKVQRNNFRLSVKSLLTRFFSPLCTNTAQPRNYFRLCACSSDKLFGHDAIVVTSLAVGISYYLSGWSEEL
jgi:hypothetical protein